MLPIFFEKVLGAQLSRLLCFSEFSSDFDWVFNSALSVQCVSFQPQHFDEFAPSAVFVLVWFPELFETTYLEDAFGFDISDAFPPRPMECHGDGQEAFSRVPVSARAHWIAGHPMEFHGD